MKNYFIASFIFLSACSSDPANKKESAEQALEVITEVSTAVSDTLCFIKTEGIKNQDTAAIKLVITNNDIKGKMMYLPEEKDWRIGDLTGTRQGDELQLTWIYMQEGVKDSIPVMLKMEKERVLQKTSAYDKNGRETIPDTAQYRVVYERIDCTHFPKYDFDLGL